MIADVLKPFTISHIARTSSFNINGTARATVDGGSRSNIRKGAVAKNNAAPRRPQPDNQRGMSFD